MNKFENKEKKFLKHLTPNEQDIIFSAWRDGNLEYFQDSYDKFNRKWLLNSSSPLSLNAVYRAVNYAPYKLFGVVVIGEPPLKTKPKINETYWTINLENRKCDCQVWGGLLFCDENLFNQGLCWGTKEGAIAAAKALKVIED